MDNLTVPPLDPVALVLWALSNHLYQGACPDEVEGFESRDLSCMACYYTDRTLQAAGLPAVVREPLLEWEDLHQWEIDRNIAVARAMANDETTYAVLLDLMEAAALSIWNEFVGQNHLPFVQSQCRTDPVVTGELLQRVENLSTMYFMGEGLSG